MIVIHYMDDYHPPNGRPSSQPRPLPLRDNGIRMSTLPLFPQPLSPLRAALATKLADLASHGIYLGTSSWKYPGWLGSIYTPERYHARGRFSNRKFEQECLGEYAETFPVVCGDFAFYQFPSPEYWKRLFGSAPPTLCFAFKVPEEITVRIWPSHARYGPRAGQDNPSFLNADLFRAMFLDLLEPYRDQVVALIFEFGAFPRNLYESVETFLGDLDTFLNALPKFWRYAVEIRNPEFLAPEYLDCLRRHGVAHVFNAWTRMPELRHQIELPGVETAEFTVTRALLRLGRPYEQAVRKFQPYSSVQEPNPPVRAALASIIGRAKQTRRPAYIFVNNRLEGNAPGTIAAVLGIGEQA